MRKTISIAAGVFAALIHSVSAGSRENPLAGSEWGYEGRDMPYVRFESEQRLVGHGGCNAFFGSYHLHDANGLSIGPLAGTRKMCAPEVMKEEEAFMKGLESATSYRRRKKTLEIFADGLLWAELRWRDWD